MNAKEVAQIDNLASAVLLQAAKDYCFGSARERNNVIKDLNSQWMDFLTQGRAKVVAQELELHADEIKERLRRHSKEE
jgi:hypothetical protein